MGVRYPGPVSRHNLVCPLFLWYLVPVWDRFATTVAKDAFGRHGAIHDLALRGGWSEWLEECHGKGKGVLGTSLVHPNGSARPWVLWCG